MSKQAEAITTIFELFCSFLLLHTHNLNFFLLQLSIINSETKGQRERERETRCDSRKILQDGLGDGWHQAIIISSSSEEEKNEN